MEQEEHRTEDVLDADVMVPPSGDGDGALADRFHVDPDCPPSGSQSILAAHEALGHGIRPCMDCATELAVEALMAHARIEEAATTLGDMQREVGDWRRENVPDATALSCAAKLSTEANEVLDVVNKDAEYRNYEADEMELAMEAGDAMVALLSTIEALGLSARECFDLAMEDNWDRDDGEGSR